MEVRKTRQRLHTLQLLEQLGVSHGFEIATKAQLKLGTVYGVLMTFEKSGHVESCWEPEQPQGRPRRKLYRLTDAGHTLLSEYQAHFGPEVTRGFLASISQELHSAIDQTWGGMFDLANKAELRRHQAMREKAGSPEG